MECVPLSYVEASQKARWEYLGNTTPRAPSRSAYSVEMTPDAVSSTLGVMPLSWTCTTALEASKDLDMLGDRRHPLE